MIPTKILEMLEILLALVLIFLLGYALILVNQIL